MTTPMLQVSNLNAWYGESHVLHGVDMTVGEGETITILGRNGVGKTTTLALDPKVLLLDEPMAGMGQEDIGTVSGIIREVARTRAVLMVEHNLSVVSDICHHVTVLQRGEILAAGDYATVAQDERVRLAYMGTEDA